ncbi:MAG TPA: amidohydrolase family protein [Burkholderiales bacterium]|jgi:predicted TIM-barrel fold metal-dependent hydrolase|nr:amidohydrolase family protein [Burkholderiales bacterium]
MAIMTIGGPAWLNLTPETALEPALPICDPHHHIWAQRHEPPAYQRYLLPDLAADIRDSGHNIRSTVFIEVRVFYRADGPQEMRPVGEVAHINGLADEAASGRHGPAKIAAAIVGHADLKLGDRVAPVLEAMQAASPRFRGIRHATGWDASPELAQRDIQGVMATSQYRAGARVLAKMGLTLDNSLYHTQLDEFAALARAVPELTIVLNHIGGLVRVGPYANRDNEVLADWRRGIAAVAACPNVVLKLGGVGQKRFGFDWLTRSKPIGSEELAQTLAPLMHYCIEKFGPDRCMFESNFPVDKVSYAYTVVFNAFKRLSKDYSASERAALFHDTAARVYRIAV